MAKKKEIETINTEKIKVKFHRDYIGKLGIYHKGMIYELPKELYQLLKIDCEVI
jgi:hypothetical protein